MVQEGDIICVVCGTNLLTGQKVSDELQAEPEKQKSPLPKLIGVGLVAAVVIVAMGVGIYFATRDPVRQALGLMADGKDLEAIATLSKHIDKTDNDERALQLRGELRFKTNQFLQAALDFEHAANVNPKNVDAAMWGVASLHSMGGNPGGRDIALLEKVVRTEPQNTQAWYVLSLARFAAGDTNGQMEALDRVIELDPAHAGARLGMGIGKAITGDLDGAAMELVEAARGNRNGNMASVQGFIASMQDDSRAVSYLEEAMADQTLLMRWQTQTQLATLAMEEGRFQDARMLLEDARALNPASDTVRYLHGLSLYGLDLQAEAQVDFDAVSVRGGAHATDALVLLADTQLALSQLDLAHGTIEKALSAGAGSAPYHTVRGRVAAARNDLSTARNAFNRAINQDRDYAPAWLERGLLFIRRNADSEGIRDLQRYLEILGDDTIGTNAEAVRALVNQLQGSEETPSAGGRID